jgi:Xaa-Pro aminopeptidase
MGQMELRAAAARHDRILVRRLDELVPTLMRRAGFDAWVIAAREYNEDPVLQTMLPATWLDTSRRRTIVVFLDRGDAVDRMAVGRYAVGEAFESAWDPAVQPDQWARLAEVLAEADPARIGVHRSSIFPLADGLSASEASELSAALPPPLRQRITSADELAIGWLETRLDIEADIMAEACRIAHGFLGTALSPEVITAGATSTTDVEWWLRQAVHDAGHGVWFQPTVSVQRVGGVARDSFAAKPGETVIEPGDLVHIDFGITHHGYCTDQQQHAYVLRPGERAAPDGFEAGMGAANRLQDLLMSAFRTGSTGNEILASVRAAAQAEGIDGLVYTHPIGVHGHAAGPTIGLWDRQNGVPGQGDYPVWPNTAYSIELQARVAVAEWGGQMVQFMLEEEAFFDGEECRFLDGRQSDLWLI